MQLPCQLGRVISGLNSLIKQHTSQSTRNCHRNIQQSWQNGAHSNTHTRTPIHSSKWSLRLYCRLCTIADKARTCRCHGTFQLQGLIFFQYQMTKKTMHSGSQLSPLLRERNILLLFEWYTCLSSNYIAAESVLYSALSKLLYGVPSCVCEKFRFFSDDQARHQNRSICLFGALLFLDHVCQSRSPRNKTNKIILGPRISPSNIFIPKENKN